MQRRHFISTLAAASILPGISFAQGKPIRLVLDDGTDVVDERILDHAPGYRLDPAAARLFGGDRPWTYDFDFVTTDRILRFVSV